MSKKYISIQQTVLKGICQYPHFTLSDFAVTCSQKEIKDTHETAYEKKRKKSVMWSIEMHRHIPNVRVLLLTMK